MDRSIQGYLQIEKELARKREQAESVKGKDTHYRVEFRYPRGTKHYQYFCDFGSAKEAKDSLCRYNIFGDAVIERPNSKQIQIKGPRGGWKAYRPQRDNRKD